MKSKVFTGVFIGFVVFLLAITYISHVIYTWSRPQVTVCFSSTVEAIERVDTMRGKVVFTDEYQGFNAITEVYMEDVNSSISNGWIELSEMLDLEVCYDGGGTAFTTRCEVVFTRSDAEHRSYFTYAFNLPASLGVTEGETVAVTLTRTFSADYAVPVGAVRSDYLGDYMLRLDLRETIMGLELVAIREDVQIFAKYNGIISLYNLPGDKYTDLPIILYADRPVEAGQAVRVEK